MTGRVYSVSFADVSVSAVQDLLAIYSGSTKAFKVHSVTIGQKTATAVGNLSVTLKRLTSLTAGSGGSTPTPIPMNPGDAAATITAHANDTTQATGTSVILAADDINVINGWLFLPPAEDRPVIGLNSAFVVSLNTAPGAAEYMSGSAVIEELF